MARYYHVEALSFRGFGYVLEENVIDTMSEYFDSIGDHDAIQCVSGTEQDLLQGTVLYIYRVPVDITNNLAGKDNTYVFDKAIDLFGGIRVRFGVRTGNSHHGYTPFETPVLVIALDGASDSFMSTWMTNILDALKKAAGTIIDAGMDQYWDWCDANLA